MSDIRWDQPSRLLSVDDDPAKPTERLIELAIDLSGRIPFVEHHILDNCDSSLYRWYKIWPGEHYNLLTAAGAILDPKIIWEFGTFTGMGTLSLLEGALLAKMYTVDNNPPDVNWFPPYEENQTTKLKCDFLSDEVLNHPMLPLANLIFIDGPKDGHTEAELLDRLATIEFKNNPIFIFDDIREMNMVYLWRALRRPKIDMTSFGHFTGTGLVDWNG